MPDSPTRRRPRSSRALLAVVALVVGAFVTPAAPALAATTGCASGSVLDVVAHQDDDLFFQNPDIQTAIAAGKCVTTAYITAGDDGRAQTYWQGRELGVKAAYAEMAGVANSWTAGTVVLAGKTVVTASLTADPAITLVYFRLPDGGLTGAGNPSTGNVSVPQLEKGYISSISAVDGTATYTRAQLVASILALMTTYRPGQVNTQDYVGSYGDGDHADHHAVAILTHEASGQYTTTHTLTGFLDYATQNMAVNLTSAQIAAKSAAFYTYAPYDTQICSTAAQCAGSPEAAWLQREYTVDSEQSGGGDSSLGTNIALNATATASSQNTSTGQLASNAIDGIVDGYPGDYTKEWATQGQGVGATITLTWAVPQTVDHVTLFDRPNLNDRITAGTLTFSDGSTVAVPSLADDGTGTTVSFSSRSITSVKLTVTGVSSTTTNVGLAEFQVWTASSGTTTPPPSTATNVSASATPTASSQNTADGQSAAAAIDGTADGYPGDYTKEWATVGGGVGSWLQLTWAAPQPLTRVVLFDRPNLNDQVTSGHLLFSDGSTVSFGSLDNAGAATTIDFSSRSVTSVRFVVDGVSSTTVNVGLAELQAWTGTSGSSTPTPTPAGTPTPTPTPTPTGTPTPTPTPTPTGTPTPTPTPTPTGTPTPAPTPTPTPTPTGANLALTATATASSQATNQTAAKAIDGKISGYPTDATAEWASAGGKAGSWILLTWSGTQSVSSVTLYDRPNSDDQITGGTLTFSDGSTVTVPSLDNTGAPVRITFPARSTTSIKLTITSVSSTTKNVGLAEFEVR